MIKDKIKTKEQLIDIIKDAKNHGKIVGLSLGVFDLLTGESINYFEKAKSLCDIFIVGICLDELPKRFEETKKLICPCEDRTKLIAALECVTYVFNFDKSNSNNDIVALNPNYYIISTDSVNSDSIFTAENFKGEVKYIETLNDLTYNKIIKKVVNLYGVDGCASYEEMTKFKKCPAVFLDRDGVINEHYDFLSNPKYFTLIPQSGEGIKKLQDLGFRIIIATNQPGIGYSIFTREDFFNVTKCMFDKLLPFGVKFTRVYYCPYTHVDNSSSRKPKPGMLLQAKEELNIDMENSFMIGDRTTDIECGKRAGVKTILVKTGAGGKDGKSDAKPDYIAENLYEASKIIEGLVKKG